jgi:iron(III) transport system substrate-binding protein
LPGTCACKEAVVLRRGLNGKSTLIGLAALLVVGAFAGHIFAAGGPSGPTVTLYNGQHPQTTAALVLAFEKSTAIRVRVRNGDEDALANQIVQERSGSPADVFYAENSPALQFVQEKGLLSPVTPSTLAKVPSRYTSPSGDWVGVTARVSGIAYNTKLLTPSALATSVMDLAGPKWAGKLGLAPSETDFLPVITSVARAYGRAAALRWLGALKANAGNHIYPDNEALIAAVNNGSVAICIIDNYYWYRLAYELGSSSMHSAFTTFAPRDPGYVVDVSGAAVLRSSRQQAGAQRFLAFLVSKAGQEIIAHSQSYEYPLGSGVTTAQPLRPFAGLMPVPLSIAALGDGSAALALLHEAQLL